MALGQTVTVVNKSGKVVSTSKHIVNVFKEAKSAYRERKAEIKAVRDAELEQARTQKALENLKVEDDHASHASHHSRRSSKSKRSHRERPPVDRGYSDSYYANDEPRSARGNEQSGLRNELRPDGERQHTELVRRHTTDMVPDVTRPRTSRSASECDIDMDLAYGELPPPLPVRLHSEELKLRNKMTTLQQLLDEANCVQHSVVATIENLQKNPEALAAVALTLGEISTMASKMAPGVLTSMKGAFPAIIALLASPQFMIAAGVGVGVTVIALGGYKIIKKIQKRKEDSVAGDQRQIKDDEGSVVSEYDELCEIDSDLSRIELWRRGIADVEADSLGTSVDGEFITPGAGKYLVAEGVLREDDLKSMRSSKSHKTSKSKKSKKDKEKSDKASSTGSSKDKEKRKKKEPSGLRMLFKTR